MKNYLIISLLFLSVGFSQQKKTDEPNPMKGVKTQTELEYKYEEMNGEFKEILKEKTISKYDTDGNNVGWSNYDSEGNLNDGRFGFSKNITIFDSNGNKDALFYYNSDGKMDNRWDYKYDSNGNKVEALNYDSYQKLKHKSID